MSEKVDRTALITVVLIVIAIMSIRTVDDGGSFPALFLLPQLPQWLSRLACILLVAVVLAFLPLAVPTKTRFIASAGLTAMSWVFALVLWLVSYGLVLSTWGAHMANLGVTLGGIGVIAIALLVALVQSLWPALIELVLLSAVAVACRLGALYLTRIPERNTIVTERLTQLRLAKRRYLLFAAAGTVALLSATFVDIALNTAGSAPGQILRFAGGIALAGATYYFARQLSKSRAASFLVAGIALCSPAFVNVLLLLFMLRETPTPGLQEGDEETLVASRDHQLGAHSADRATTAASVQTVTDLRERTEPDLSTTTVDRASHTLVRQLTPEEEELSERQQELTRLQTELAERELELATLSAAMQSFEHSYYRSVGVRMARLDALEAEIAEHLAQTTPDDPAARARASATRERARASAGAAPGAAMAAPPGRGTASPELRSLYHELARMVHPDLTTDEAERSLRTSVMMEVNDAYSKGDIAALHRLKRSWADRPEEVQGIDTAAELLRTLRRIALVRDRMQAITEQIATLTDSELYCLKARVDEASREGEDILAAMAADLDAQITSAETRVAALHREGERR